MNYFSCSGEIASPELGGGDSLLDPMDNHMFCFNWNTLRAEWVTVNNSTEAAGVNWDRPLSAGWLVTVGMW